MCGIIGYTNQNVTVKDLQILRRVLIESRIRGKHASGLAWFDGEKIQSRISSLSIDNLLKSFTLSKTIYDGCKVSLIGHTRYSTSDIKYNQPIVGNELAIAHNGVITQDSPENWEATYGYTCATKNDSELLLHALECGDDPFEKFPDSSIAAVTLDLNGELKVYRNGLRPAWQGTIGQGVVIASTYDILCKAGVKNIKRVEILEEEYDLQRRNMTQWIRKS